MHKGKEDYTRTSANIAKAKVLVDECRKNGLKQRNTSVRGSRMKRVRNKKTKPKRFKDMTETEKTQYMVAKKKESREIISIQKKTNVKVQETERRKLDKRVHHAQMSPQLQTNTIKSMHSRATIQQKTVKALTSLPHSPRTFASVVNQQ